MFNTAQFNTALHKTAMHCSGLFCSTLQQHSVVASGNTASTGPVSTYWNMREYTSCCIILKTKIFIFYHKITEKS